MATKKSTKGTPRGRFFEITAKVPTDESFGPQEAGVYNTLKKIGPATIVQLGDKLKLETRQEPKIVAGFYLPKLRKAGFVRIAKAA